MEHYPPDTNAALAWLSRRQPGLWREKQQIDISGSIPHQIAQMTPDERAADAIDLVRTFQQIIERARSRPMIQVDEETVTVGQMIDYLRRRLAFEERAISLKQLLRNVNSRPALVCMFLALLELVRLQAIQLRQDRLFGDILLRRHTEFESIMSEEATVRDDWG